MLPVKPVKSEIGTDAEMTVTTIIAAAIRIFRPEVRDADTAISIAKDFVNKTKTMIGPFEKG